MASPPFIITVHRRAAGALSAMRRQRFSSEATGVRGGEGAVRVNSPAPAGESALLPWGRPHQGTIRACDVPLQRTTAAARWLSDGFQNDSF